MKQKFMPGPWWVEKADRSSNYTLVVAGKDKDNWETVAEVPGLYDRSIKDYVFPNATLIAFAPEMLALLEEMARGDGVPFSRIENLVAKAKGEA